MGCGCLEDPGSIVRLIIFLVAELELVIISKMTFQNQLSAILLLGLFERGDELPSTGSGVWLWHVCDRTTLASPETAALWAVSSIVLLGISAYEIYYNERYNQHNSLKNSNGKRAEATQRAGMDLRSDKVGRGYPR